MPRYPNYPTTCDETQRLELAYLRQQGLLEPGTHNRQLHWSSRGKRTGTIGLDAHIEPGGHSFLRLYYVINGTTSHDYRVKLEQQPSNLPGVAGHRWYMLCPKTGQRATVLYLRSGTGVFAHRLAFAAQQRLYYDSQLENKRFRGMSNYFGLDREWEAQWRKGRKLYYRGKPTRWHERLLRLERQTEAAAPALLRMLNGH
jgi:hypothetical protein